MKNNSLLLSVLWGENAKTQTAALRSVARLYGLTTNEVIKQCVEVAIYLHLQNRLKGKSSLQDEIISSGAMVVSLSHRVSRMTDIANAVLEESEGLLTLIASEMKR